MEKQEEFVSAKKNEFRWFFEKAITVLDELGNNTPQIAVILCGQAFDILGKKFKQVVAQDAAKREPAKLEQKIKIELIKKGIPAAEIGRRLGITRNAIWLTIHGKTKKLRNRKAIAEAIGVTVEDLWPKNGNGHK